MDPIKLIYWIHIAVNFILHLRIPRRYLMCLYLPERSIERAVGRQVHAMIYIDKTIKVIVFGYDYSIPGSHCWSLVLIWIFPNLQLPVFITSHPGHLSGSPHEDEINYQLRWPSFPTPSRVGPTIYPDSCLSSESTRILETPSDLGSSTVEFLAPLDWILGHLWYWRHMRGDRIICIVCFDGTARIHVNTVYWRLLGIETKCWTFSGERNITSCFRSRYGLLGESDVLFSLRTAMKS